MLPAFKNTFTFDEYYFNSGNNIHVNLDYLISLHPQMAINHTFLGQTPFFQSKKQKTRTNNLHHPTSGSVADFKA